MGAEGPERRRGRASRLVSRRRLSGDVRFKALVREALAAMPAELHERIDNVDIIVRGRPTAAELHAAGVRGGTLLGLYLGTPLTARNSGYNLALPDRILLFRGPLEALARSDDELVAQIRRTVLHELAHHFGIDDDRLHAIGAY